MGNKAEAVAHDNSPLVAYGYMAIWIALSATVIMFNKYILAPDLGGFPFPLTLTSVHMLVCSIVSWLLVRLQLVEVQDMPVETYTRCVVPIGVLFACTLWWGNAAYLTLSVSFIQMIKALMPMLVYTAGVVFGTEHWSRHTGSILATVVGGVLLASYGEVVFVLLGVLFQGASLLSEAVRLTLVQLLLQQRGFKLNPISTMYHISPVCFMALLIPLATLEAEKVLTHEWKIGLGTLLCSAAAAFVLNWSIYVLIGKTSALTMNVAGVVKDVLLVYLSVAVYGSHVTRAQAAGYAVALAGVATYNYSRMHKPRQSAGSHSRVSALSGGGKAGARLSLASSGSHSADWDAAVAVSETSTPLLAADGAGGDMRRGCYRG